MDIAEMLAKTKQLQVEIYGSSPHVWSDGDRIEYIKEMVLAATDELHEALGEVGWKSWASSRRIDRDAYLGELIDVLFFLMDLFIVVDTRGSEVTDRYLKKLAINTTRAKGTYTGVDEKCSTCRRALDDPAVTCTPTECGDAHNLGVVELS